MNNNEFDVNDLHFTLNDENNNTIECDILYEAVDQENNKVYIAYTDYVKDEEGKYRIVIAELINNNDSYSVIPIEDMDIQNAIKEQLYKNLNDSSDKNNE